jgi:hypothetical protein
MAFGNIVFNPNNIAGVSESQAFGWFKARTTRMAKGAGLKRLSSEPEGDD